MRTLVVIQQRMQSTRFPGKAKAELDGRSITEHVVLRARHAGYATCIAAPKEDVGMDQPWALPFRIGAKDRRGTRAFVPIYFPDCHEDDVIQRYADTVHWANSMASFTGAESFGCIVRLTGDCPLVPVSAIDAVAEAITNGSHDYAETRSDPSDRPNGIDAQAFTLDVLARACVAAKDGAREHLTPALKEAASRPGRISSLEGMMLDHIPSFRITVDMPEDLERLNGLTEALTIDPTAGRPTLGELVNLSRARPEMFE